MPPAREQSSGSGRTSAVNSRRADALRIDAGCAQHLSHKRALAGPVGRGQAAGAAILVDRRAGDHGERRPFRLIRRREHSHCAGRRQSYSACPHGRLMQVPRQLLKRGQRGACSLLSA